jgi:hypothetical protein
MVIQLNRKNTWMIDELVAVWRQGEDWDNHSQSKAENLSARKAPSGTQHYW